MTLVVLKKRTEDPGYTAKRGKPSSESFYWGDEVARGSKRDDIVSPILKKWGSKVAKLQL